MYSCYVKISLRWHKIAYKVDPPAILAQLLKLAKN